MSASAGAAEDLFLLGWICKDSGQLYMAELAYIRALCSLLSVPYTLQEAGALSQSRPSSSSSITPPLKHDANQRVDRDLLLEQLLNTSLSDHPHGRSLPLLYVELARVYLHSGDFKHVLRLQYRAYKVLWCFLPFT